MIERASHARARRCIAGCAFAAIVLAASSAHAIPSDDEVHLEAGARLGFGVPAGSIVGDNGDTRVNTDMSYFVTNVVPIVGEVGARVARSIFIGGFFQYGFVTLNSDGGSCKNTTSCDAHDVRFGVEAIYHLSPEATIDPWIGMGFGYEWLSAHAEGSAGGLSVVQDQTFSGLELLNLQLGVDFAASSSFALGPFFWLTFAKYTDYSVTTTVGGVTKDQSPTIPDTAVHEWLLFGLRGTFVVE